MAETCWPVRPKVRYSIARSVSAVLSGAAPRDDPVLPDELYRSAPSGVSGGILSTEHTQWLAAPPRASGVGRSAAVRVHREDDEHGSASASAAVEGPLPGRSDELTLDAP